MTPVPYKQRQVFNLFLLLTLFLVVTGVFIYFLSTPEQRQATTFWLSIGFLFFAALICTLFEAAIVYADSGKQVPYALAETILAVCYVLFTASTCVGNMYWKMPTIPYFLLHVAGIFLTLLPMQLLNMAGIKAAAEGDTAHSVQSRLRDISSRLTELILRLEREKSASKEAVDAMRKLADNLLYSEPSQAPTQAENALDQAIGDLRVKTEILLSTASEEISDSQNEEMMQAVFVAGRALKERNEAILRSKR